MSGGDYREGENNIPIRSLIPPSLFLSMKRKEIIAFFAKAPRNDAPLFLYLLCLFHDGYFTCGAVDVDDVTRLDVFGPVADTADAGQTVLTGNNGRM